MNPNPVIKQAPHVPLNTTDRLALHELANRYGNTVDARDWDTLRRRVRYRTPAS